MLCVALQNEVQVSHVRVRTSKYSRRFNHGIVVVVLPDTGLQLKPSYLPFVDPRKITWS